LLAISPASNLQERMAVTGIRRLAKLLLKMANFLSFNGEREQLQLE